MNNKIYKTLQHRNYRYNRLTITPFYKRWAARGIYKNAIFC